MRMADVTEKQMEAALSENMTICVWKADLATFVVDGVVNAANKNLQHNGGLALALKTAGGPIIQAESDLHIRNHGQLNTGDAMTNARPMLVTYHAKWSFTQLALVSQRNHQRQCCLKPRRV